MGRERDLNKHGNGNVVTWNGEGGAIFARARYEQFIIQMGLSTRNKQTKAILCKEKCGLRELAEMLMAGSKTTGLGMGRTG